jgi:hypothetical protein
MKWGEGGALAGGSVARAPAHVPREQVNGWELMEPRGDETHPSPNTHTPGPAPTASFMSSKTSPAAPPGPAALASNPSCAPSAAATRPSRPSAASLGRLRRRCALNVSPKGWVASRLARAALPPTWRGQGRGEGSKAAGGARLG